MQGLLYSVTATFTTIVLAIVVFAVEHYHQFSSNELVDTQRTKAQAIDFLEAFQKDISNMVDISRLDHSGRYSCHVSMTRNGRTRQFTFPTLIQRKADESPHIVQVTYELQGQARQAITRNGKRDLYWLRRYFGDGSITEIHGADVDQVVDFLVEIIPDGDVGARAERIVSGGCPTSIDQVYIEFHLAISNAPTYASISRYSSIIDRTSFKERNLKNATAAR